MPSGNSGLCLKPSWQVALLLVLSALIFHYETEKLISALKASAHRKSGAGNTIRRWESKGGNHLRRRFPSCADQERLSCEAMLRCASNRRKGRTKSNQSPRSAAARCKEMAKAKTKTKSNRRFPTQIPQVGMLYGDSLHLIESLLIRLLIT